MYNNIGPISKNLWEFVRRGFFDVELLILGTCLAFVIFGDLVSGTSTDGINTIKD